MDFAELLTFSMERKEQVVRTISILSRGDPLGRRLATVLIAFCASACSGTKRANSLQSFKQDGQRTLFEVTDKGGRSWRVGSVELPSLSTYFVISSDGRVDVIATTFE